MHDDTSSWDQWLADGPKEGDAATELGSHLVIYIRFDRLHSCKASGNGSRRRMAYIFGWMEEVDQKQVRSPFGSRLGRKSFKSRSFADIPQILNHDLAEAEIQKDSGGLKRRSESLGRLGSPTAW